METDYVAALARASNSATPAEELERLWQEMGAGTVCISKEGHRVLDAIARNPNLPVTLAPACLGKQASALAENPALPLLMLECPDIARKSKIERLLRTLRRLDTPAEVVHLLAQHHRPIVAEAARLHVALAGELSEAEVETELRKELAALPIGGKAKLQELHDWGMVPIWLAETHHLKSSQVLPPDSLFIPTIHLGPPTQEQDKGVQRILDKSSWVCHQLHEQDKSTFLRQVSFNRPHIQAEMIQVLEDIVQMPIEILAGYYGQGLLDWFVFKLRTNLPHALQGALVAHRLAEDASSRGLALVLAVAGEWPVPLLEKHTRSRNWLNRLGVALNPQTPEKNLQRLRKDANRLVRGAATYRATAGRGFGRPEPRRSA
jgi:hypothetical protein